MTVWLFNACPPSQTFVIVTTYSYDQATGELLNTQYSDNTPSITNSYNRIGQAKSIVDAAGSRTFVYNDKLQQTSEQVTGLYDRTITRTYQGAKDTGFAIANTDYNVALNYDSKGRPSTLQYGSASTNPFTTGYFANSNLVESLTYPNGMIRATSYETNRNLVKTIDNSFAGSTISSFNYTNDPLSRRTKVTKTGSAFSQHPNGTSVLNYSYNDRSEVISAVAKNDSNYNYGYDFDNLGSRITTAENGVNSTYSTNNLNQYTEIAQTLPQTTSLPVYNEDGCMLENGQNSYVWNGENRLVEVTKDDQRLTFVYDYMGRRVSKKVYERSDITSLFSLQTSHLFVYDNYKLIEEQTLSGTDSTTFNYLWNGEQLLASSHLTPSTSQVYFYTTDANKNISEVVAEDGSLGDDNNPASLVAAHYEYSPFGKLIKELHTSDFTLHNSFRFSSEYCDKETELVYYNYRYYSPELGSWLSRDPIEEQGGLNLYGFVGNDGVNNWEKIGLSFWGCAGAITLFVIAEGSLLIATATTYATVGMTFFMVTSTGAAMLAAADNVYTKCICDKDKQEVEKVKQRVKELEKNQKELLDRLRRMEVLNAA